MLPLPPPACAVVCPLQQPMSCITPTSAHALLPRESKARAAAHACVRRRLREASETKMERGRVVVVDGERDRDDCKRNMGDEI